MFVIVHPYSLYHDHRWHREHCYIHIQSYTDMMYMCMECIERTGNPRLLLPDCYIYPDGNDYVGDVSVTEIGLECQRWDSQTPHSHSHSADDFPEKDLSLASNYCRNPNGRTRPWCYTTDPDIEWDFCPLGRCHTGTEG